MPAPKHITKFIKIQMFSKKGHPSTWFEKTLLLCTLGVAAVIWYPTFIQNKEYQKVFYSANENIKKECKQKTNYINLWLWQKNKQEYYDCIVASSDKKFQDAAAKFLIDRGVLRSGLDTR